MRGRAAWMLAWVFVLAGCSTSTVTGAPVETVLTKADLYDPCTLPVTSLTAIGVDPKPIDTDFMGVEDPEWHLCDWKAESFFIVVLSTTRSYREVMDNPRNEELRHLVVADRNAVTYFDVSDPSRNECDVAFATQAGVIIVRAQANASKAKERDPCAVAQESAISLSSSFPR